MISMTCRYTHLAPSHQLAAVRRLDRWGETGLKTEKPTDTRTGTSPFKGTIDNDDTTDYIIV